jgi:hypothetical protein
VQEPEAATAPLATADEITLPGDPGLKAERVQFAAAKKPAWKPKS